eukprot:g35000.t1
MFTDELTMIRTLCNSSDIEAVHVQMQQGLGLVSGQVSSWSLGGSWRVLAWSIGRVVGLSLVSQQLVVGSSQISQRLVADSGLVSQQLVAGPSRVSQWFGSSQPLMAGPGLISWQLMVALSLVSRQRGGSPPGPSAVWQIPAWSLSGVADSVLVSRQLVVDPGLVSWQHGKSQPSLLAAHHDVSVRSGSGSCPGMFPRLQGRLERWWGLVSEVGGAERQLEKMDRLYQVKEAGMR